MLPKITYKITSIVSWCFHLLLIKTEALVKMAPSISSLYFANMFYKGDKDIVLVSTS